jgi:hypothetical protein
MCGGVSFVLLADVHVHLGHAKPLGQHVGVVGTTESVPDAQYCVTDEAPIKGPQVLLRSFSAFSASARSLRAAVRSS